MKQVDYVRCGNRVQRFHTVNLLVPETVGHHSANVAMLTYLIHPSITKEGLLLALTHDLTEQYTGDVPAPAKWASEHLKSALEEMEERYEMFPLTAPPLDLVAIKQADMLDLCLKCLEEFRMGNRTALPLLHRGIHHLRSKYPFAATTKILQEIEDELSK